LAQLEHAVLLVLNLPLAQDEQVDVPDLNLPLPHAVHDEAPATEFSPDAQPVQPDAAEPLYEPALQFTHVDKTLRPVPDEYLPDPQAVLEVMERPVPVS
jgi:hypothetical protein